MAKLYFYYSAMNAGKTTTLLQSAYNYRERSMRPLILAPRTDDRPGDGTTVSRIGLEAPSRTFGPEEDLLQLCRTERDREGLDCVLVDEAQFLSSLQVRQLAAVVDELRTPVLCYGLRTDFRGALFSGSAQLLAWADELCEIKTICHCGSKATMVLRTDADRRVIREGEQIEVGGNERYTSVCRRHFLEAMPDGSGPDRD